MFHLIFALIILTVWSYYDLKYAEVHGLFLFVPLLVLPFIDFMAFVYFFLPMIIFLYIIHKKTGDWLPMADVIALPFTFFFMTTMTPLSLTPFPFVMWILMKRPPKSFRFGDNKVKFIPVLLISFLISFGIHLLFLYNL